MPSNPSLEAVSAANATKRKNAPRDDEDGASESGSDVVSALPYYGSVRRWSTNLLIEHDQCRL